MMYLYQSECRELPYYLSLPNLKRCPYCSEKHVSLVEEVEYTILDEKLATLSKSVALEDVLIANKTNGCDVWFFVYVGPNNFRVMGYAPTETEAVEMGLALGFSGKKTRMIVNWGTRKLCGEDFKKLWGDG